MGWKVVGRDLPGPSPRAGTSHRMDPLFLGSLPLSSLNPLTVLHYPSCPGAKELSPQMCGNSVMDCDFIWYVCCEGFEDMILGSISLETVGSGVMANSGVLESVNYQVALRG